MASEFNAKDYSLLLGSVKTSHAEAVKALASASATAFTQLVPARNCAGLKHIKTALLQSASSFANKTAFTKKPEFEFLARLLCEKQLNKALAKAEFARGENLVLVIGSKSKKTIKKIKEMLSFEETEFSLGKNKKELMQFYKIEKTELESLKDLENPLEELICERVAFVALER